MLFILALSSYEAAICWHFHANSLIPIQHRRDRNIYDDVAKNNLIITWDAQDVPKEFSSRLASNSAAKLSCYVKIRLSKLPTFLQCLFLIGYIYYIKP